MPVIAPIDLPQNLPSVENIHRYSSRRNTMTTLFLEALTRAAQMVLGCLGGTGGGGGGGKQRLSKSLCPDSQLPFRKAAPGFLPFKETLPFSPGFRSANYRRRGWWQCYDFLTPSVPLSLSAPIIPLAGYLLADLQCSGCGEGLITLIERQELF